ncbi:MAG: 50S ribosomal protein L28 [Anaerolineae bacterium]|nr:50S ribosomal protein L28 [Anaerolineae bacterium]
MAVCEICGKKPMTGNNVSFSQRHTKRKFRPNIQKTKILRDGKLVSIKVCTKCLKTMSKDVIR